MKNANDLYSLIGIIIVIFCSDYVLIEVENIITQNIIFVDLAFRVNEDLACGLFFQIIWKSRGHILVNFPSHVKKLCYTLRFWLEKLNCRFFHLFQS